MFNQRNRKSLIARFVYSIRIDSLEPRRFLSATLARTGLVIEGTAGDDQIRVEWAKSGIVVTTNGTAQRFDKTRVKWISANLRAGNDRIEIAANVELPTTLNGDAGNDTILGGTQSDAINGGSGDDDLYGRNGDDTIKASTGDDFISPGTGSDTVDAGAGQDEVSYAEMTTPIVGQLMAQIVQDFNPSLLPANPYTNIWYSHASTFIGNDTDSTADVETLTGGSGADQLLFQARERLLINSYDLPPTKAHRVNGGSGDDTIDVVSIDHWNEPAFVCPMVADGGDGNDTFDCYAVASVIGGEGDDAFFADRDDVAYPPEIDAGSGIDTYTYYGFSANYTMPAGLENLNITAPNYQGVRVIGNELPNVINAVNLASRPSFVDGAGGDDVITLLDSGGYVSTILGGTGNDTLVGSQSPDSILGGEGNDSISPGTGSDTVDAGDGQDEVSYAEMTTPIFGRLDAKISWAHDPNLLPAYPYFNVWYSTARTTNGSDTDTIDGAETLTGGSGADDLLLETFDSTLAYSGPLNSQVYRINGGDGNDSLDVVSFNNNDVPAAPSHMILDGAGGDDRISGYAVFDAIGGKGDDAFFADDYDDSTAPTIDAGPGIDTFTFGRLWASYAMPDGLENLDIRAETSGPVTVIGNDSANIIHAFSPSAGSFIDGRGGNDWITLSVGPNSYISTILGGPGNDTLVGSQGPDSILGGEGDDCIDGGAGPDSIFGGDGIDRAKRDDADVIVDSIEIFF